MIVKQLGAKYIHNGITYCIGDAIRGIEGNYVGKIGFITEIYTDEDMMESGNEPEFYCSFIDTIRNLDMVKLFSGMFEIIASSKDTCSIPVYLLKEEWASDNENGVRIEAFSAKSEVDRIFLQKHMNESKSGLIKKWKDAKEFKEESDHNLYKCWLDGHYVENHYELSIQVFKMPLSNHVFGTIGRRYQDSCYQEDFKEYISKWDEISDLTEEQYTRFINDSSISERIQQQLSKNDEYSEQYWNVVENVAKELLTEYKKEQKIMDLTEKI